MTRHARFDHRLAEIARKSSVDRDRGMLEFLQNTGIPAGGYSLAKLDRFNSTVDRLYLQTNLPYALRPFGLPV